MAGRRSVDLEVRIRQNKHIMRLRCPLLIICAILLVMITITAPGKVWGQSNPQLAKNAATRLSLRLSALQNRIDAIQKRLSTRTNTATASALRSQRTRVSQLLKQKNDLSSQLSQISSQISSVVDSLNLLSTEATRGDYLVVRVKLVDLAEKIAQILSGQKNMLTILRQIAPVSKASPTITGSL